MKSAGNIGFKDNYKEENGEQVIDPRTETVHL